MKKSKLITSLCTLVLTLACLTFGVYSAVKTAFTASGTITFNAYGVDCLLDVTISGIKASDETTTDSTTHLSSKTLYFSTFSRAGVTDNYTKVETTADMGQLIFDELNPNLTDEQRSTITITIALKNYSKYAVDMVITSGTSLPDGLTVTPSDSVVALASTDGITPKDATQNGKIVLNASKKIATTTVNFATIEIKPSEYTTASYSDFTVSEAGAITAYSGSATKVIVPNDSRIKSVIGEVDEDAQSETDMFISPFKNCTNVVLQENITSIDMAAFAGCTKLKAVALPDTITIIDQFAFVFSTVDELNLPQSLETIGAGAFAYCSSLKSVNIPSKVTSIPESAFAFSVLKSIVIPCNVTTLEEAAFRDCTALETVVFESGNLTTIGDSAFSGCTSLSSIAIPESVTTIGYLAFSGCTGLTSVAVPNSVTDFGAEIFKDCTNLTKISVPATSAIVEFVEESTFEGQIYGHYENKLTKIFTDYKNITDVVLQEGITELGQGIFEGWTNLKNITLPNSLISIGYRAFLGCVNLNNITIPTNVTTISALVFSGCTNLTLAKFENIDGWEISDSFGAAYVLISEEDTPVNAMSQKNATLLREKHVDHYWKRGN